jgi:hypothetical protein
MPPKAVKPPDPARKEKSFIEGIPLLTYPGSPEDFHAFETAWKAYAERTFPLVGRCFEVDEYEAPAMPNQTNHAAQLALFDTSIRAEMLTDYIKRHLKTEDKREEEKRRVHGAILSVTSQRSIAVVRASKPEVLTSNQDPLGLWRELKKTHKSGLFHLAPVSGRLRLEEELIGCKQRYDEHPEEFAQRFKTVAAAYHAALPEAERPSASVVAHRFYLGVSKLRNPRFVAEIEHREISGLPLPATVDAMMTLMQSCAAVESAHAHVTHIESEAVAFAASTQERERRCFRCGKVGHMKKDCKAPKKGGGPTTSVVQQSAPASAHMQPKKGSASAVHVVERVTVSVAAEKMGSIFMDSCATHHIISDRRLVTNIREADRTFVITGFNGAEEQTALLADCMSFGEVIFVPKSRKNIISLGRLGTEYKVKYDHGERFTVSAPDGRVVCFDRTDDALFEHVVISQGNVNAVDTVAQRELTVGAEQLKRAKQARRAEEVLGFPSPGALAYAINNGAIQDASFTAKDVAVAERVLGPHPARMMGKATRAAT